MSSGDLSGRTIAVTGAASGIGRACAMVAAGYGARVVLVDRDLDGLDRVVDELRTADAVVRTADLADVAATRQVGTELATDGVDGLVCAAGLFGEKYDYAAGETSAAAWAEVIAVNVTAPLLLIQALLPSMVAAGRGAFVAISSLAGVGAFPNSVAYTSSKSALLGLVRSLAVDYAPLGIRSNAVIPGAIDTPGVRRLYSDIEAMRGTAAAYNPMQRIGTADEVAEAAAFLLSDRAAYVNGSLLYVDGGRHVVR